MKGPPEGGHGRDARAASACLARNPAFGKALRESAPARPAPPGAETPAAQLPSCSASRQLHASSQGRRVAPRLRTGRIPHGERLACVAMRPKPSPARPATDAGAQGHAKRRAGRNAIRGHAAASRMPRPWRSTPLQWVFSGRSRCGAARACGGAGIRPSWRPWHACRWRFGSAGVSLSDRRLRRMPNSSHKRKASGCGAALGGLSTGRPRQRHASGRRCRRDR